MTESAKNNTFAKPIVSNVIIIGEAVVGGTLKGHYTYHNASENPEHPEGSLYSWTVGGQPKSNTQELLVIADYVGKPIVFHVIPRSASDEYGDKVSSDPKQVESGFQNISDEENYNSFMKQHGNFSFYVPEPSDRIFVSTGGVFSLIDAPTDKVHVQGQAGWGYPVPDPIKNYLENNPALTLFATERDFSALIPYGRRKDLIVWGNNMPATTPPGKLDNIRAVYANGSAFAFIYEGLTTGNKWIEAIGHATNGGTVPDSIHLKLVNDPPKAIYATYEAFAVLTTKGKVYAWGNTGAGGTIDKDAQALLDGMKVTRIIANMSAFCAIDDNTGQFVTWGNQTNGGKIPADRYLEIMNQGGVKSVIASRAAFVAITRGRAIAVSWGNAQQGGDMHQNAKLLASMGGIVLCRAATWAFTMININGQAEAWGHATSGGTIPKSTGNAGTPDEEPFLFSEDIKSSIQSWFKRQFIANGINVDDDKTRQAFLDKQRVITPKIVIGEGVVTVYGNDTSFFMMAQDEDTGTTNEIWVWGLATGGGQMDAATRQVLMRSYIREVYCTNGAYGVILTQGNTDGVVIVWGATLAAGDAGQIPTTPPEIAEMLKKGVIELYSIKRAPPVNPTSGHVDPSFAARHKNGKYVLWGGNVTNQVYDPQAHKN